MAAENRIQMTVGAPDQTLNKDFKLFITGLERRRGRGHSVVKTRLLTFRVEIFNNGNKRNLFPLTVNPMV